MHEAALRVEFGGHSLTRKQLEHIVAMSEREQIADTVQLGTGRYSSQRIPNWTGTARS
ncbi:Scr1 family TA system antitoxin-like transcriptional regulator [Streptomyces sp. CB02923]|uniref:Scr1 family TA system antitoxin-like transcriptional regulator n=1 Tax=Streptomyces sp. CB02923 TaxID=1718985 RepID=UPI0026B6DF4D